MGLVQYESSDEDEEVQTPLESQKPPAGLVSMSSANAAAPEPTSAPTSSATATAQQTLPLQSRTAPNVGPEPGPQLGPVLGPARPPPSTTNNLPSLATQLDEADPQQPEIDLAFLEDTPQDDTNPPPSPYTKTRTLLHNLTLPAHPNMDIPPSPPGTPPPGHDALTSKFTTFLQLKRTQGVHFNARLAASAGMRNPSVGDKLMGFVGFEIEFASSSSSDNIGTGEGNGQGGYGGGGGEAVEQYCTVLSPDVWDGGVSFPSWAYKGPLRRAQERGARERERAPGEAVEFVKGGTVGGGGSGTASRAGTPGLGSGSGTGKRKGRWDT